MSIVLELAAVSKTFTMHLQGGIRLPVVAGVEFAVGQENAPFSPARPARARARSSR